MLQKSPSCHRFLAVEPNSKGVDGRIIEWMGPARRMQREPQMMPSTGEMLIILALFVLFFGVDKLPKIARSLGMAKGEFQQGLTDSHTEITEADLERGGRTEAAAITEAAEEVDVEVEGKSVAEVEAELEEE